MVFAAINYIKGMASAVSGREKGGEPQKSGGSGIEVQVVVRIICVTYDGNQELNSQRNKGCGEVGSGYAGQGGAGASIVLGHQSQSCRFYEAKKISLHW